MKGYIKEVGWLDIVFKQIKIKNYTFYIFMSCNIRVIEQTVSLIIVSINYTMYEL